MVYKVTGACHSVCVCVCGWVWCAGGGGGVWGAGGGPLTSSSVVQLLVQWGQSSVVRGVREGRGGKDGREFSFLTAWWMKLSFSLLVLAWRLRSLLPDGSRLKKLCVGWVVSPAM